MPRSIQLKLGFKKIQAMKKDGLGNFVLRNYKFLNCFFVINSFMKITADIFKNEGWRAFYNGLTPRVLRVAPGQAITFMVYERVYKWMIGLSTVTHHEIRVVDSGKNVLDEDDCDQFEEK